MKFSKRDHFSYDSSITECFGFPRDLITGGLVGMLLLGFAGGLVDVLGV